MQNKNYAWVVLAIIFSVMLVSSATRAIPGVLLIPLHKNFNWSIGNISFAISLGLMLYGLTGPFSAAAMKNIGIKITLTFALVLLGISCILSYFMTTEIEFIVLWGVMIGIGTGIAAMTLGATVVNRWFTKRRGLAIGLLGASSASGQLVFLPMVAYIIEYYDWKIVMIIMSLVMLGLLIIILFWLPESPNQKRTELKNNQVKNNATDKNPIYESFYILRIIIKDVRFWIIFFSFFVCGASTNGLIGTHFIALCSDHGYSTIDSASLLAFMGIFDILGTTFSGWLTDKYSSCVLLCLYYFFRGISLIFLPSAFDYHIWGIPFFVIFYGLDWIATVPPTIRLTNHFFGQANTPIIFGWIFAGHQLGAATASFSAGLVRDSSGNYNSIIYIIGFVCISTSLIILSLRKEKSDPSTILNS